MDGKNYTSNESAVEECDGIKLYLNNLTRVSGENVLNGIQQSFRDNNVDGVLDERQLRKALEPYGVSLPDEHFKPLYAKIDVRKEGAITFSQFVTYLASEYETKRGRFDVCGQGTTDALVPAVLPTRPVHGDRGRPADKIVAIAFRPFVGPNARRAMLDRGEYVVARHSGNVSFYRSDLKRKKAYALNAKMTLSPIKVNGLLVLPDFDMVCVSTLNGDICFYQVIPNKFKLCLTIGKLPGATTCMTSTFNGRYVDASVGGGAGNCSKIAVGNNDGSVLIVELLRGNNNSSPFQWKSGETHPPTYDYEDLVVEVDCHRHLRGRRGRRGRSCRRSRDKRQQATIAATRPQKTGRAGAAHRQRPLLSAYRFDGLHASIVNCVQFCESGAAFLSVSLDSMTYCRPDDSDPVHSVSSPYGFVCACEVGVRLVATGGLDKLVRLWNMNECAGTACNVLAEERRAWAANNRTGILVRHVAVVQHVFHNHANGLLYSVSRDRVVKVSDVQKHACLLTFEGAVALADSKLRLSLVHFNQLDQVLVMVVGNVFVSLKCGKAVDDAAPAQLLENTIVTGSHSEAVVKTMYNSLFRVLISMSAEDSTIIVWNPLTGKSIHKITMAHTEDVYSEILPVEITAASFDPSGGLLVTGAVNGTVHMWDPNTGKCLNQLRIPSNQRISEIIWLPNKVLVASWDRQVTEFNNPLIRSNGKVWRLNHNEALLSLCVKIPSLLVTTSRSGELGFWRLETGQLIKKHKVRMQPGGTNYSKSLASVTSRMSTTSSFSKFTDASGGTDQTEKDESVKQMSVEHFAAVASHFLQGRPESQRSGDLAIATRNGVVQLWSTFKVPRYVAKFVAIHVKDDYVTAMNSDPKSNYLFTSLYSGYVKTWYIANFGAGYPRHSIPKFPMLSLRLRFPFLLDSSLFIGRAQRAATSKNPNGPLLVNSYRAHTKHINHIEYIDRLEIVVTSSVDKNIRLWTLAGQYVGTLGSSWPRLPETGAVRVTEKVVPSDIKREASFTTINVLKDGMNSELRSTEVWDTLEVLQQERRMEGKSAKKLQGADCPMWPLHGVYYNEFSRNTIESVLDPPVIKADETKSRVMIFKHVTVTELVDISVIPMLLKTRNDTKRKITVTFKKNDK